MHEETKYASNDNLLTMQEMALFLKVPVSWVYGCMRGRSTDPLPGYDIGKCWRFRAEEFRGAASDTVSSKMLKMYGAEMSGSFDLCAS